MIKGKKAGRTVMTAVLISAVAALSACGGNNSNTTDTNASKENAANTDKKVTLRFFSNLPDRKSGQGLAEQMVIDNYIKENPNVTIEVEALAEEPFKNKLKAYMASNEPIDITMVHGGAELNTLVQAGYVKELSAADYDNDTFKFLPGSYKSFTFNNKLYGLPRNSDYEVIYYNKRLFEENGIKVPTTYAELLDAGKKFREKGIEPVSVNGKDLWSFGAFFQDLTTRVSGDQNLMLDAVEKKKSFVDDENFKKAAELLAQARDQKLFQDSLMTADYGASQNLFTQERAAMWYMGSWEAGMATNESLSESFRNNVAVLKFPVVEGGKGKDTDLLAWNGGGYSLVSSSKQPEEAKKFFDYLMSANQWAKTVWDTGAAVPAQTYELSGSESELQKQLTEVLTGATSTAGSFGLDFGSPKFKDDAQNALGKFFAGGSTPEQLLADLQKAAENQ
jgi:raffinose/stachyose/melibiose transport system substrate-binding protein